MPSPTRPPRSPVKNPTFPGGNTFLDLEDAPSLAEQIRGLRRVSSCPVLERHREAHVEDNAQTVQTPVSPKSPLSEPHVQDQGKEQIDQTDQAAARTRLSSSAKMFQPKPVATVPAPSTTYFAAPPSRTYAMQGVQSQMLPSQPSMWAWSQQFQSLPGTCESPNQKGLLLSTASPSVSKPKAFSQVCWCLGLRVALSLKPGNLT